MSQQNPTIIVGYLDDSELTKSIDKLVNEVANKTTTMAGHFTTAIGKMQDAMKDFAITQKVSVDLMKEAWRDMSKSFDAMVAAQEGATRGGGGKTTKSGGFGVNELRSQISNLDTEIKALGDKSREFLNIRDRVILYKNALRGYRADVQSYDYRMSRGEVLSKTDMILYEEAKKKVESFTKEINSLLSQRHTIPAPSKEDIQRYNELIQKREELNKALNKAMSPETVGDLKNQISIEDKYRDSLRLGTQELKDQNELIAQQKARKKEELMTEEEKLKFQQKQTEQLERQKAKELKKAQSPYLKEFNAANTMSTRELTLAEAKLARLQNIQRTMQHSGLFDEAQINRVQKAIDNVTDKITKLRNAKPKSLNDVLGMDANSIDQIAAKMRALKMVQIDPNNAAEVKRVGDAYAELKRKLAQLMGQNIQLTHSNNYLAQSFGYIRNRIVYALTLGALTNFVKQIYEIRGQYELLERSLGVLVNSFERGSQIFNELNQMAIESPFTLMELAGAAKQLTAYNFEAKEVVDTTRRLADLSAALGVPMERLTYNLGQIRAQTVLTARDARDFANAGLPIVTELAKHYSELEGRIVSTGDVYDRMSKKMVSYSDVMTVLNKMTDEGGKFFEFQAKQAQTLRVQMANLSLAWNNMLNEIGESNQGLVSFFPKLLKELLQNWRSISRVLKNVVLAFGFLRIAQMIAIRYNWQLAASAGGAAKMMGILGNAAKNLGKSLNALVKNRWSWAFVVATALFDFIGHARAAREEIKKLNKEISEGAKEASQSNLDFLSNKGNRESRELAERNKLTAEQGGKAWESIRNQIEQSAMSSSSLISKLEQIGDINERVKEGFNYVESIQKAQAALEDLKSDSIEVTTDSWFWGVFGTGLVSDLISYVNGLSSAINLARKDLSGEELIKALYLGGNNFNKVLEGFRREFLDELSTTVQSITSFINAYNIKDPIQINEVVERIRAQIKAKNPEIKEEYANIFDIELDKMLSEQLNGAFDKNYSLWNIFAERLKHNYSSVFQGLTDDFTKETGSLSKEQQDAIDANLKYFQDTMPLYYNAMKDMVNDASKLRINIGVLFGIAEKESEFQKETKRRAEKESSKRYLETMSKYIGKRLQVLQSATEFRKDFFGVDYLPKNDESFSDWVDNQQKEIKKLEEENKKYQKDDTEWSKGKIAANDKLIQQYKNRLDLFNQAYKKEDKGNGSKKDPVLDTLKEEISLVEKLQGDYDKLAKSSASQQDALSTIYGAFGKTIDLLNARLDSYGLPQIDIAKLITGKNPHKALEHFKQTLDSLVSRGLLTFERSKELEAVMEKLTLSAKTYDLDMITKGLNNELGKLKDEYELAVELDADPELGNMFTEMFGIDTTDFPKTIDEYMNRAQQEFDKMRKKRNFSAPLNIFKAGDKEWEEWGRQVGLVVDVLDENGNVIDKNTDALDKLTPKFKEAQGVAKKWAQDTVKGTKDLEYELGDLAKKIEMEKAKLAVLEDEAANETNAAQKHLLELQIQKQKEAIEKLKMESVKLLPFYEDLFGDMYNVSVGRLKEIAKAAKEVMTPRKGEDGVGYVQRTDSKGNVVYDIFSKDKQGNIKKTTISLEEYIKINKQIDSVQQKIAESSPWEKIKDSFSKKNGGGLKNFASGMETIGGELQKIADITKEIGGFAEALGADDETVEIINDVATSIGGVATVAQGIGQIAKGDYIGGAASVLSGAISAISTWLDNSDKKITAQIESSEREVKKLENTYKNLEVAIENAYGANVIGAKQAAIANKELQLAELQRQLALEKSRDSKDRDEDKIVELQGQIIDLQNDIKRSAQEIATELLGISSVGDAALSFMDAYISALRKGEDAQVAFTGSWKEMIANMIKQLYVTKVIGPQLEALVDEMNERLKSRSKVEAQAYQDAVDELTNRQNMSDNEIREKVFQDKFDRWKREEWDRTKPIDLFLIRQKLRDSITQEQIDAYRREAEDKVKAAQKELNKATTPTIEDLDIVAQAGKDLLPLLQATDGQINELLDKYDLYDDQSNKTLSTLQQGIQGITEDTAVAIEAYLNGVSQQVYLHSDLLTQIRDAVVGFDIDIQTASLSQILLQLQSSYQVQMSIQGILEGWNNASGQAVRVELVS